MSKVIETLTRLFDSRFIEPSHIALEEPEEKMRRVIYKGSNLPDENMMVCRLDQNTRVPDMFPYLRGNSVVHGLKGMKRICDYVIFVDTGGYLYVLLIEMKKGNDSPQEQLNLTEPLIDFIFRRAKILKHLDVNYKIRKIGITDKSDKRKTSDRGSTEYDANHYVKLYCNERLYIQRLLH